MKYVQLRKQDYDKSVKLNDQLCLCYSAKKLKSIENGDVEILGEVIKGDSKKKETAKLSVENKLVPVYEEGTFSKALYKRSKYIAVEESDGYIVVLENRLPFLLWLLGLILVIFIAIMLLINQSKKETVDPYNALPPIDSNVETVDDNEFPNHDSGDIPEDGGKVGIGYQQVVELSLSTKTINMKYANTNASNHDAVIEFYIVADDNEYLISTSGRIPVGSELNKMTLSSDAPILSEGIYNAMYKVYYYNSETGEKSLVSSNIKNISLVVNN